jgi:hypothetical protein
MKRREHELEHDGLDYEISEINNKIEHMFEAYKADDEAIIITLSKIMTRLDILESKFNNHVHYLPHPLGEDVEVHCGCPVVQEGAVPTQLPSAYAKED